MAVFLVENPDAGTLAGSQHLLKGDQLLLYSPKDAQIRRTDAENIMKSGCTVEVYSNIKSEVEIACIAAELGLNSQAGIPVSFVSEKSEKFEEVINYIRLKSGTKIIQKPCLMQAMLELAENDSDEDEGRKKTILSAMESVDICSLVNKQMEGNNPTTTTTVPDSEPEKVNKIRDMDALRKKIREIISKTEALDAEFAAIEGIEDEIADYVVFVQDKSPRQRYPEATHRFGWQDGKDVYNLMRDNHMF